MKVHPQLQNYDLEFWFLVLFLTNAESWKKEVFPLGGTQMN